MASRLLVNVATFCADTVVIVLCAAGAIAISEKADLPIALNASGPLLAIQAADDASDRVRTGDSLLAINGVQVRSLMHCEFILDRMRVGDSVHVTIRREGTLRTASLRLVRYYDVWYIATTVGIASIYLLLGLIVALRRPFDASAHLFHLVTLSAVCTMSLSWGSLLEPRPDLVRLLRWMLAMSLSSVSMLLVHFVCVFPDRMLRIPRGVIPSGYVIAAVLAVLHIIAFERAAADSAEDSIAAMEMIYRLGFVVLAGAAVLAVLLLARTFRRTNEESIRRIIRLELAGVAIAMSGFLLLWWFPRNLFGITVVSEALGIVPLVVAPVAFAVAVLRYRALEVDIFVRRGTLSMVMLGFILVTLTGAMALVWFMIGPMLTTQYAFRQDQMYTFLVAMVTASILIAILIEPVRRKAQHFIDRRIFNVRYNHLTEVAILRDSIRECLDEPSVTRLVAGRLRILLEIDRTAIYVRRSVDNALQCLHQHGFEPPLPQLPLRMTTSNFDPGQRIYARPELVEAGVPVQPLAVRSFQHAGIVLVRQFTSEDGVLLGAILCGYKRTGMRFAAEDIELIHAVAEATAHSIERIRLHRALVLQNEETQRLSELNRMKSFFVSAVTHDLKTPLTFVYLFSELLEQRTDDMTSKHWLRIIRGETDRLTVLIDNVLGFAQIEQGRRIFTMDPIDLNDVARRALDVMQYQFDMHHVALAIDLYPAPCCVHGDATALQQAVINLLGNAIKYSPQDRHITIRTRDEGSTCSLSVADRGEGIAPEHLAHIFEPFMRVVPAHTGEAPPPPARAGGTGLGLTIVRDTIAAHDGLINVASKPGEGTVFTMQLKKGGTHVTDPDHRG